MRRLADDQALSVPVLRPTLPLSPPDDNSAAVPDPVLCPFALSPRVDEKDAARSPAKQVIFFRSVEQRLEGPVTGSLDAPPLLPTKGMSVGELRHTAEDEATTSAAQRQQAQQLLALKKVQWDVLVVRSPVSCAPFPFANDPHRLHASAASRRHRRHCVVLFGDRVLARNLSDIGVRAVGYVSRS